MVFMYLCQNTTLMLFFHVHVAQISWVTPDFAIMCANSSYFPAMLTGASHRQHESSNRISKEIMSSFAHHGRTEMAPGSYLRLSSIYRGHMDGMTLRSAERSDE